MLEQSLRMALLNVLVPLTKRVGEVHVPFSHKKVTGRHVLSVLPYLKPGAVFVSRIDGELSNLLIPGEFTHAAMCHSSGVTESSCSMFPSVLPVVEAIGRGVVETDIISFMTSKDRILLLYPKFATDAQMRLASEAVYAMRGRPYDYYFTPGAKAFYCSELCLYGYTQAMGQEITFTKRTTLGVNTVVPGDFPSAVGKWEIVWDSDTALPPVK